jgi:excisionase family DNA binding protein
MEKFTELLTIGEVAEILRVHPTTIYRLVKRGVLPGFKIGGNWRVDKGSFYLFLSEASPTHLTPRVET